MNAIGASVALSVRMMRSGAAQSPVLVALRSFETIILHLNMTAYPADGMISCSATCEAAALTAGLGQSLGGRKNGCRSQTALRITMVAAFRRFHF